MEPQTPERDGHESVGTALASVMEEGQRVVVDRIDLALLEARMMVSQAVQAFSFALVGVLLLAGGWIALNWALAVLLAVYVSGTFALFTVAAVHIVLGAIVLLLARRRGKNVRAVAKGRTRDVH
jgi:hypothetical protein